MHCWKTINVQKQYGHNRIFLVSAIFVMMVFSVFYISMTAYKDSPVSDRLFPLFVLVFLMIYPAHKFLHFLPLMRYREKLRFSIERHFKIFPVLAMRIHEPILKSRYLVSLMLPFIVLNSILIIGAILFPAFRHYFAILLAYHCGLCVMDLLYIKHLVRTPKKALIEETDKGFEILISPSSK